MSSSGHLLENLGLGPSATVAVGDTLRLKFALGASVDREALESEICSTLSILGVDADGPAIVRSLVEQGLLESDGRSLHALAGNLVG